VWRPPGFKRSPCKSGRGFRPRRATGLLLGVARHQESRTTRPWVSHSASYQATPNEGGCMAKKMSGGIWPRGARSGIQIVWTDRKHNLMKLARQQATANGH